MDLTEFESYVFSGVNNSNGGVDISCFATDDELIAHIASLAIYAKQERNICINQILLDYYYAVLTADVEDDKNENY